MSDLLLCHSLSQPETSVCEDVGRWESAVRVFEGMKW